jgi:hypothetical protein
VPTADPPILAQAMLGMYRERARYAASTLRERAVSRFSAPVVAQELLDVFAELTSGKPSLIS